MKGQTVGYIRVSSTDQNTDRQLAELVPDRVFTDKLSGKDTERPQLQACLTFLREGDTLLVHSIDRIARNLDDLRKLVTDLNGRGVVVHFVKEGLVFSGDDSHISKLMLSIMGAFAEFERAMIRERQREGIALAQKRGVYKGRSALLTEAQAKELRQLAAEGEMSKADIARHFGIARATVYKYLEAE